MIAIRFAIVALSMPLLQNPPDPSQLESRNQATSLTYIANEGILLRHGEISVVIDGLFREGVSGYATVPASALKALESASAPYDSVRLILVTHHHKDHFDAKSVAEHLKHNPEAILASSQQVCEQVREIPDLGKTVAKRVRSLAPEGNQKAVVEHAGVTVEILRLSHGTGRFASIWNLGYVVHMGGKRFLHIGDAELNPISRGPLKVHARDVDVACIPYWLLYSESDRTFITESLRPKQIVAIHVPPKEIEEATRKIHEHLPHAIVLVRPGEAHIF